MQRENNTIIQILTSNKYDASNLNTMNNRKVKTICKRERKWVKKKPELSQDVLRIPSSMFPSPLTTP
jgi:hypothetical protein